MHPELFGAVQAYPVLLVIGDLVGVAVAFWCARRAGVDSRRFALALFLLTVAAFGGAKLYGLIERGGALGTFRAELVSGYRYPGGIVALAAAIVAVSRIRWVSISPGRMADVITPAIGFALAVIRIGCFLAGCCAGAVSDLPWAVHFPARSQVWHAHVQAGFLPADAPASLAVHPLQLYFGLLALLLALFALRLERHKRHEGEVFLAYVALYGAGQFGLEFLRFRPLPHVQYASALLAVLAGTLLLAGEANVALRVKGALMKASRMAVIAFTFAVASPLLAEEGDSFGPGAGDAVERGAVTLGVEGVSEGSGKQLSVSVRDEGGGEAAAGVAEVEGFPFIQSGQWADTEWKVSGSEIIGTLRNRQGKVEGTFQGTITRDGIRGTFTHADGRVGSWTWSGPLPAAGAVASE